MPGFLDRLLGRDPLPVHERVKRNLGIPAGASGTTRTLTYPRGDTASIAANTTLTFSDPGPFTNRLLSLDVQRGVELRVWFDELQFFFSPGDELGDIPKIGRAVSSVRVEIRNTTEDERRVRLFLVGEVA